MPDAVRDRVQGRAEHVERHQPVLAGQLDHRLAQPGIDQRVEDGGPPAGGGLERLAQLLARLDPGVAEELGLEIGELALRGPRHPRGGVAGRVGDDVDLEGVGHAAGW